MAKLVDEAPDSEYVTVDKLIAEIVPISVPTVHPAYVAE